MLPRRNSTLPQNQNQERKEEVRNYKQDAEKIESLIKAQAEGKVIRFTAFPPFKADEGCDLNPTYSRSILELALEYGADSLKLKESPRKLYTLPLTEIDALEITRDMWKWLSEDIGRTKKQWLNEFQPSLINMAFSCACCEFATKNGWRDCSQCPLKNYWGNTSIACDYGGRDYNIWSSNAYSPSLRLAAALRLSQAAERRLQELQAENKTISHECDVKEERAKKQPTLRPWKPEEVPVGAVVKHGSNRWLITAVWNGKPFLNGCDQHDDERSASLQTLTNGYEHSLDLGKTWLPCGVME